MNEKDCIDHFIVGYGFGVSRVPLASPRPSLWLPSPLRFKMRGYKILNYLLPTLINIKGSLSYLLTQSDYFLLGFLLLILFFRVKPEENVAG